MPVESVLDASRGAMNYERARMDAASRNIAGANVPIAPGQTAQSWSVSANATAFSTLLSGDTQLERTESSVRQVSEPGHPYADAQGMVRYPDVDMTREMTTMMGATRSYEANVKAFNLLRGMMLRGLEIGAK